MKRLTPGQPVPVSLLHSLQEQADKSKSPASGVSGKNILAFDGGAVETQVEDKLIAVKLLVYVSAGIDTGWRFQELYDPDADRTYTTNDQGILSGPGSIGPLLGANFIDFQANDIVFARRNPFAPEKYEYVSRIYPTYTSVFIGSGPSHAIGIVPDPGSTAGTTKFLREDATWANIPSPPAPTGTGIVSVTSGTYNASGPLTGDVTTTGGGLVTTIANSVLSNAKLANMPAHTFKGNNTGSTGVPLDLTVTQATAELNVFVASGASHAKGLVPDPGASAGTTKFLREDATFAVPAGSVPAGTGIVSVTSGAYNTPGQLTGDVTTTGGGLATTIANQAVGYQKLQYTTAASVLLGRGSSSGAGLVEEINLDTGLQMSGSQLSTTWLLVPPGCIMMWPTGTPPTGWLLLDGSTYSSVTYPALFAVLGTTTLPDWRGRSPIGAGTGSGLTARTLGTNYGAETHTIAATNLPSLSHTHPISTPPLLMYKSPTGNRADLAGGTVWHDTATNNTFSGTADPGGSSTPLSIIQPSIAVNYIIKAK